MGFLFEGNENVLILVVVDGCTGLNILKTIMWYSLNG